MRLACRWSTAGGGTVRIGVVAADTTGETGRGNGRAEGLFAQSSERAPQERAHPAGREGLSGFHHVADRRLERQT
jgi:hypothetical protein